MSCKFRRNMRVLAYCIFVIIIIFCSVYLLKDLYYRNKEQSAIEQMRIEKQNALENADYDAIEDSAFNSTKGKQILKEYRGFYEADNDFYGWIKVEDTDIDFPVMFTPDDPDFYENKNLRKEILPPGAGGWWIWIDGNTTEDTENVIIYGHNMKYGEMFGSLKKYYKEPDFYEAHKYIQFDTLYERGTYEIISVVKTKDYSEDESHYRFYDHIELDSEEEFREYVDNAKKNAEFHIETTAEFGDRLITLSTCDYWTEDGRILIIAKKIR